MNNTGSEELLRTKLKEIPTSSELSTLPSRLEHLPLALVQAAVFIEENSIPVRGYLQLLEESDQTFVDLLSEELRRWGETWRLPVR
jgi:hypothetical protein